MRTAMLCCVALMCLVPLMMGGCTGDGDGGSHGVNLLPGQAGLSVSATAAPPVVAVTTGQTTVVTLIANVSGGTPPYKYVWSGSGPVAGAGSTATATLNPLVTTTYTFLVTVTDDDGEVRTGTATVTVLVNP